MKTIILSAEDIRTIIAQVGLDPLMDELISALAEACRDFDAERYTVPARDGFHYRTPGTGMIEWMPVMENGRKATIKMVAYHPDNPSLHRLPTILSSLLIFDTDTGHLGSIVDGTFLTAMRTGAASALASRILASPDSATLGLIGCGAQAITQLHALSRVFDIRTVVFFDSDRATLDTFSTRARRIGLAHVRFEKAEPERVAAEADILCTCTSVEIGGGPVIADRQLKDWIHINAVGSDFPGKFELPYTVLARGLVVPDFRAQAIAEGECQQLSEDQIGPDLVTIVAQESQYDSYRSRPTVFDSTGWSFEDHVAAAMLLGHARRIGIGAEIQLESISGDPKDPYGSLQGSPPARVRKLAAVD